MGAIQAAAPLCIALMVATHSTRPLIGWYVLNFAAWFWVAAGLAIALARAPTTERWIVLLAVITVLTATLRDVVAARISESRYDESAWAKYAATLIGIALMWIVSQRFLRARTEAIRLSGSLARQVAEKEQELRRSFGRVAELERSRAVLAERERILRDMHDGVGASLATAVRQLEGGRAGTGQVLQTLRESMEQLKLSIDALNLPPGDVNALLASLRYRMQARIESAGIEVRWDVDELPRWTRGTEDAMRQLQFILLEVVSNTLQHARARTLSLRARETTRGLEITVTDDGVGMAGPAGNGLRSIQARADAIGACVRNADAGPGTTTLIDLPMSAAGA